jgi:hypothetical protein
MNPATLRRQASSESRIGQSPLELSIEEQAQAELSNSHYLAVRKLTCQVKGGVLMLRGWVPSFHLKQVAHNLLRPYLERGIVLDDQSHVAYDKAIKVALQGRS